MKNMMTQGSIHEQIKKQEDSIALSRRRISDLKKQVRDKQGKRLIKAAEKAGLFKVEISDEALNDAFEKLITSAGSPPKKNADLP